MPNTIKVYKVRAFTYQKSGGNFAGVCILENPETQFLTDNQMQNTAKKMGYSETAFVQRSARDDYSVRFFTPESEVDMCGHATIATFGLLRDIIGIKPGKYKVDMKAGQITVTTNLDAIWMKQNNPQFLQQIEVSELLKALNLESSDFVYDLKPQAVSTGLLDLIIPIKSAAALMKINPDFELISEICKKHNLIGFHCFALDTLKSSQNIQVRNFAPLCGINEESATGTSNGALFCYLHKNGLIQSGQEYLVEQGHLLGNLSNLYVKIITNNQEILEVWVGGQAVCEDFVEIDLTELS